MKTRVEITGLQSNQAINGSRGNRERYDAKKDRYIVVLDSNDDDSDDESLKRRVSIRPRNLTILPPDFGKVCKQEEITSALHALHLVKHWKKIFSFLDLDKKFLCHELSCLCKAYRDALKQPHNELKPEPAYKWVVVPSERFPNLFTAIEYFNERAGDNRFIQNTFHEIRLKPGIHTFTDAAMTAKPVLAPFTILRSNFKIQGYGKDVTIIKCKAFMIHRYATGIILKDLSMDVEQTLPITDIHNNGISPFWDCNSLWMNNIPEKSRKAKIMELKSKNIDTCHFGEKKIKFKNTLDSKEFPITIQSCDIPESRVSVRISNNAGTGTMLNKACLLGFPNATRNLLEAGADINLPINRMSKILNGRPLKQCLFINGEIESEYGDSVFAEKLATLDALLQHLALDINVRETSIVGPALPPLMLLLQSSGRGPKGGPLRTQFKHNPWRSKYERFARQAALKMLEHPLLDIEYFDPICSADYVRTACYHNAPVVLQKLLDQGADPNNVDVDNITPLFYCLTNQYFECAKILAKSKRHKKHVINIVNHVGGNCEKNAIRQGATEQQLAIGMGYGHTVLTWASLYLRNDQNDLFELICKIPGIDLDKPTEWRQNMQKSSPLEMAAGSGNYGRVKTLIKYGANLDSMLATVAQCCMTGDLRMIREVIGCIGIEVLNTYRTHNSLFPLWVASQNNFSHIVKYLLEQGDANINDSNCHGTTSLMIAVQYGNIDVVEILLKHGANVNHIKRKDSSTALTVAAFYGHPTILQMLLKAGANANAQDEDGWTSLFLACTKNFLKCANLLLKDKKTDINLPTYDSDIRAGGRYSPLCACVMQGNYNMVKLLLDFGANGDFTSKSGSTPMSISQWGQQPNISQLGREQPHNPFHYKRIEALLRCKGFKKVGTPPALRFGTIIPFTEGGVGATAINEAWDANGRATETIIGGDQYKEGSHEKRA